MKWLHRFGPGLLVTAAFIGPGTITTASVAGSRFGFALLWALVFSVFATIVLQEMSARLGLVTRRGLGESIRTISRNAYLRTGTIALVVAGIGLGNAAFQAGNIAGAAMGLQAVTGVPHQTWTFVVGGIAFALLSCSVYRVLERVLIGLVVVMSIVFLLTTIIVQPDIRAIVTGMVTPSVPTGGLLMIVALIGTTVVPYNLFLHASLVCEKWPQSVPLRRALKECRIDTSFAVLVGGLITFAITATAAQAFFGSGIEITNAAIMAKQLEALLGRTAKYFFATGLLAAGLTSAVTAPLAAAYAMTGALGWGSDLRSGRFRAVWASVIVVGTTLAYLGKNPVQAIVFAQAANGILLPLIAIFLLVVMNREDLLGEHKNGVVANVLGAVVVLTATGLGVTQLYHVVNRILSP